MAKKKAASKAAASKAAPKRKKPGRKKAARKAPPKASRGPKRPRTAATKPPRTADAKPPRKPPKPPAAAAAAEPPDDRRRNEPRDEGYAKRREYNRQRMADQAREGRDIGELPAVEMPERRAACLASLEQFLTEYFADKFPLEFSDDHRKVISKTERAVKRGGLFAEAMPRGSGKTTIATRSALWAVLNGHPFAALIGATGDGAVEQLDALKTELETNELLLADFPEVCWPIWCLEGIANRCKGQLYQGERTRIVWQDKRIILPTIPGSPASSAVIKVCGITGRIRGMQYTRPDGKIARPTIVIVDDPQTDESARSPEQCRKIERTLAGAILGLAGPSTKISGMMPCTVIVKDDAADRILDRTAHPEWQGERMKAVYAWPTDEAKWDRYQEILRECWATGADESAATEYFRDNYEAMIAGAEVAWPERKMPGHLHAIETAYYLRARDGDEAYWAEYQNDPIDESQANEVELLPAKEICEKQHSYAQRQVPVEASKLTAFIDVGEKYLYWMVVAWRDDFTGWIVDYGAWPDQAVSYFSKSSAKRTIAKARPGARKEGRILYALKACWEMLSAAGRYTRPNGTSVPIDGAGVDAGDGDYTEVVFGFCLGTEGRLVPTFGRGIGAKDSPMSEWRKTPGESRGIGWQIPPIAKGRPCRHVHVDVNQFKSLVHAGWMVAAGDPGSITLFKAKPSLHRMLGDHMHSEKGVRVSIEDGKVHRTKTEWTKKPNVDNEGLDVLVGCAAVAARLGCRLPEHLAAPKGKTRIKLSDIQRQRGQTPQDKPTQDKPAAPPKKATPEKPKPQPEPPAESKPKRRRRKKAEEEPTPVIEAADEPQPQPQAEPEPPAGGKRRLRLSDIQRRRRGE